MLEEYRNRIERMGGNIRESLKQQSVEISESLFSNSTSIRDVILNGVHYEAKVTLDSKTSVRGGNGNHLIEFRNSIDPTPGSYVQIPDNQGNYNYWLILYESDELSFRKHIIKKCNYQLRWKDIYGNIVSRWVVLNDNYRLQNGDTSVQYGKMNLPYYTINVILPYDSDTINIRRDKRFLIDDPNVVDVPDAFIVTNRNIESKSFGDTGVIELGLSQHQYNSITDDRELMIADCYVEPKESPTLPLYHNLTCKITYSGTPELKMGSPFKTYVASFYQDGKEVNDIKAIWKVEYLDQLNDYISYQINDNELQISCKYNPNIIGSHIKLTITDSHKTCIDKKTVKVVSTI